MYGLNKKTESLRLQQLNINTIIILFYTRSIIQIRIIHSPPIYLYCNINIRGLSSPPNKLPLYVIMLVFKAIPVIYEHRFLTLTMLFSSAIWAFI